MNRKSISIFALTAVASAALSLGVVACGQNSDQNSSKAISPMAAIQNPQSVSGAPAQFLYYRTINGVNCTVIPSTLYGMPSTSVRDQIVLTSDQKFIRTVAAYANSTCSGSASNPTVYQGTLAFKDAVDFILTNQSGPSAGVVEGATALDTTLMSFRLNGAQDNDIYLSAQSFTLGY